MSVRQLVFNHVKNIRGWKTPRKIVVFAVDDYGNVRVDSKEARLRMDKSGLKVFSRFDYYDALETADDLQELFATLTSVKDKVGRSAVFTAYALPCNIDFDAVAKDNFSDYHYELLTDTFSRTDKGKDTWQLWQQGIKERLLVPQFHGREHLNLKVFEAKLKRRDREIISALKNRSYTSITDSEWRTIGYTAAFDFWDPGDFKDLRIIIRDGLAAFEKVFGQRAQNFTPPGGNVPEALLETLKDEGVDFIDSPFFERQHAGFGKYKWKWNYTGKNMPAKPMVLLRNAVFEPTANRSVDWASYTLKQIETAFRWNSPAIISSHRINFSGHVDEKNRKEGISALRTLLREACKRWPDIEFMSSNELGNAILAERTDHV